MFGHCSSRFGLELYQYPSQYHSEFSELEFIVCGAFGKVYRVKTNRDGTTYAVEITNQATIIQSADAFDRGESIGQLKPH